MYTRSVFHCISISLFIMLVPHNDACMSSMLSYDRALHLNRLSCIITCCVCLAATVQLTWRTFILQEFVYLLRLCLVQIFRLTIWMRSEEHITVLNTVGNCNTVVNVIILYYNIMILWDHHRICVPSLTETSLCDVYL
jgi:hypothetical protein